MEFKTESGAEVIINMADFMDSSRLRVAVLEAIKESGVELSKIDIDKLKNDINTTVAKL